MLPPSQSHPSLPSEVWEHSWTGDWTRALQGRIWWPEVKRFTVDVLYRLCGNCGKLSPSSVIRFQHLAWKWQYSSLVPRPIPSFSMLRVQHWKAGNGSGDEANSIESDNPSEIIFWLFFHRYYIDGTTDPLWEEWLYCYDLGVQLAPVIKKWVNSSTAEIHHLIIMLMW